MTIAYIYKWTHLPTLKWYIGVRTKKDCHPDDGYICSSKIVKPLIKNSPEEWQREILHTGSPEEMIKLETVILTELDAKNNTNSCSVGMSEPYTLSYIGYVDGNFVISKNKNKM